MHERYMRLALEEANAAFAQGEVPVGCVIVRNGAVIARGHNRREQTQNALSHAETEAIRQACKAVGDWRLADCTLYVTLEPCPMCAGALVNARVDRVVFGAYDARGGACGSMLRIQKYPLYFMPEFEGGMMAEECAAVLTEFFAKKR